MGIRTYIPGIILIVKGACRFMDRYDNQIRANLPPEYLSVYEALHEACDAFEAIIPFITPTPGD
jgi:hypothetical protein